MRRVQQILINTGVIVFLLFFSVLSVYGQSAIRLVIPIVSPACFNGIDDDSDGLLDYPDDTDCADQSDASEHHLTATCSVSATTVTLGQPTIWTIVPLGGSTTYAYSWSGSEVTGDTENITLTYSSIGSKTATVTVTSGPDSLVVNCSDTVTVTSAGVTPELGSPSSGGGGGTSGGLFLLPVSPLPVFDTPPTPLETPNTDSPSKLDSAPEKIVDTPLGVHSSISIKVPKLSIFTNENRDLSVVTPLPSGNNQLYITPEYNNSYIYSGSSGTLSKIFLRCLPPVLDTFGSMNNHKNEIRSYFLNGIILFVIGVLLYFILILKRRRHRKRY